MIAKYLVVLGALVVLDGLWLGVVMRGFYRERLAHLARMTDGGLDPIWPIAALVYPVLALGITMFVLPRVRVPVDALLFGAAFGAISFAVYDLTNHATLRDWRASMTIVDILWGACSCAAAAWVAATVTRGGAS